MAEIAGCEGPCLPKLWGSVGTPDVTEEASAGEEKLKPQNTPDMVALILAGIVAVYRARGGLSVLRRSLTRSGHTGWRCHRPHHRRIVAALVGFLAGRGSTAITERGSPLGVTIQVRHLRGR